MAPCRIQLVIVPRTTSFLVYQQTSIKLCQLTTDDTGTRPRPGKMLLSGMNIILTYSRACDMHEQAVTVTPRLYQQQCPCNIVECYKLNDSFDNVECCFDVVAVSGNNVTGFGNNVEWSFVLSTKSKQIERVQFVSTLSKWRNFTINVRHCCRLWQQSRMLLRQRRHTRSFVQVVFTRLKNQL